MFDVTLKNKKKSGGQIYNVGGGEKNAVTLNTIIKKIEKLLHHKIAVTFKEERPGDQHYFVSDTAKAQKQLGWRPAVGVDEGLAKLIEWMKTS